MSRRGDQAAADRVLHGRGAWFGAHHDTAEALADAGFIVAAINHPGDNANDSSRRDALSVWATRPVEMIHLLDFMLHDWKDKAAVDPARVGVFGFSLGGAAGLVLAGTKPDFERLASLCQEKTGICAELRGGALRPDPPHDARVRAAVIVDPAPPVFTSENLAVIRIPLQFWRSELGGPGVGDGTGDARIAGSLPGKPELHVVPAGHYAFLAPCSTEPRSRRTAHLHRQSGRFRQGRLPPRVQPEVMRFFREHLVDEGGAR